MTNQTFRSLDQAPKLVGFTIRQWLALIAGAATLLAIVHATRMPTRPAISLCVLALGLPAALMYVSETGGLSIGMLLRDAVLWRVSSQILQPPATAIDGAGSERSLGPPDHRARGKRAR